MDKYALGIIFSFVFHATYTMDPPEFTKKKPQTQTPRLPTLAVPRLNLAPASPATTLRSPRTILTPIPTPSSPRTFTSRATSSKKYPSLIELVRNDDLDAIHLFLADPKKNPNAQDKWGNTAVHHAVILDQPNTVFILLSHPHIFSHTANHDRITPAQMAGEKQQLILYNVLAAHEKIEQFVNALLKTDPYFIERDFYKEKVLEKIQYAKQSMNIQYKTIEKDDNSDRHEIWPNYATDDFIVAMLNHLRIHNHQNIVRFFGQFSQRYPNKNAQDEEGNTQLHYAVVLRDHKTIQRLLEDPETNSAIKNNAGKFAHQFLSPSNDTDSMIRTFLFMCCIFDLVIHKEACALLIGYPTITIFTRNDSCVKKSIKEVKKKLKEIPSNQGDSKLPKSIRLDKVKSKFIFEKLICHLTSQKQNPVLIEWFNELEESFVNTSDFKLIKKIEK